MKLRLYFVILLSVLLVVSGCGSNIEKEITSESIPEGAPTSVQQTESSPATTPSTNQAPTVAVTKVLDFGSIEQISDLVDDAIKVADDATEDVDDFTILANLLPMHSVNSTIVMSTLLDYAFNGLQDNYAYSRTPMPNGAGDYEGSLSMDGEVYKWLYNSYFNNGIESYLKLLYEPNKGFVEVFRDGNDKETDFAHTQIHRFDDNSFVASMSEYKSSTSMMSQVLLMGRPGEVYYAYRVISATSLELPFDLKASPTTDWNALIDGSEFDFVLTYNGSILEYTGQ